MASGSYHLGMYIRNADREMLWFDKIMATNLPW